jgi:preprotein translocase subunit SecF
MGFAKFGNELYSGRRSLPFIARRRLWYGIAVALMLISVVALATRGLNSGIEFRGGSQFQLTKVSDTSEKIGADAVRSVSPGAQSQITKLGTNGVRVQTDKLTDAQTDKVKTALAAAYHVPEANVAASFVGPSWGKDISRKALQGLLVFLVLVTLVMSAYFRTWKMAVAGLVALLHDLLLTIGVYAITGFEVTPATVIGFLTILGYSLYDTVVVFDKVRENTEQITLSTRRTFDEAANLAINQTLVRSINTSVVALLPVASILFIGSFVLGAGTLKDISLALFVGIAAGTYSSIFIATPLLVDLRRNEPALRVHAQKIRRRRGEAAQKTGSVTVPAYGDVDDVDVDAETVGAGAGTASRRPVSGGPAGAGAASAGTASAGAAKSGRAKPRSSASRRQRSGKPRSQRR